LPPAWAQALLYHSCNGLWVAWMAYCWEPPS
jgi:hypothetical protein